MYTNNMKEKADQEKPSISHKDVQRKIEKVTVRISLALI